MTTIIHYLVAGETSNTVAVLIGSTVGVGLLFLIAGVVLVVVSVCCYVKCYPCKKKEGDRYDEL